MNRRQFFGTMIGGIATGAAVRTWPFRVFSFPSQITLPAAYNTIVFLSPGGVLTTEDGKVWRNLTEYPKVLKLMSNEIVGGNFAEIRWTTREDPLQFPEETKCLS